MRREPKPRLRAKRETVDLSPYSDLVVIYLGMYAKSARGLTTLLGIVGPIKKSVAAEPDGLLLHEFLLYSLLPLHAGMRQYWRDFDALERWARSGVHREWWDRFVRNPRGTGFWHETYSMKGGIDAIYAHSGSTGDGHPPGRPSLLIGQRQGLHAFADARPARGSMFSARQRAGADGPQQLAPVYSEGDLYGASHRTNGHPAPGPRTDEESARYAQWRERMRQLREGA